MPRSSFNEIHTLYKCKKKTEVLAKQALLQARYQPIGISKMVKADGKKLTIILSPIGAILYVSMVRPFKSKPSVHVYSDGDLYGI